jgi:Caspase domain
MPEPGPVGRLLAVTGTSPPLIKLVLEHEIADGERIRLCKEGSEPVLCYVKKTGVDEFAAYSDADLNRPASIQGIVSDAKVVRLATEDWAVVVGINYYFYRGLPTLRGPTRDADLFSQWLKNVAWVPDDQVLRVPASSAMPATADEAKPTVKSVGTTFKILADRAAKDPVLRLGRRLYIFLSGHGIVPLMASNPDYRESALLAADADNDLNGHMGGRAYAEWFRARGIFDEVILFADCCRDNKPNVPLQIPQLPHGLRPQREEGRQFYAAPAKLGFQAWERDWGEPPEVRGGFSYALIKALNDPTLCDADRNLTGSKLAKRLYVTVPPHNNMMSPMIDYPNDPTKPEIIFVRRQEFVSPKAIIRFSSKYRGKIARFYFGADTQNPIDQRIVDDESWEIPVELNRFYKVEIADTTVSKPFEPIEAVTNVTL